MLRGIEDRCFSPDDHLDPRGSSFFVARSVLSDIRNGRRPCASDFSVAKPVTVINAIAAMQHPTMGKVVFATTGENGVHQCRWAHRILLLHEYGGGWMSGSGGTFQNGMPSLC